MTDTVDLSGRTFGGYVLREKIGEGSFGVVYCCEQPLLGREAVVKVLHPKLHQDGVSVQRFLREAQLASRLDHPYAAHVYAFGVADHEGLLWIAMERVQGVTLKSWLRDHGPMPLDQFVPFFERVAEVVQTAHERGIVHRDLKPSNMMVLERAGCLLPKLLDLGVAKLLDGVVLPEAIQDVLKYAFTTETAPDDVPKPRAPRVGPSTVTGPWSPPQREDLPLPPSTGSSDSSSSQPEGRSRLTTDNATIGSPPYMSPEQWSNAVTVGPASDLYALAVVAFEALTGSRPFEGGSLADYAELHCRGTVPALGGAFAPALDHVLQRALAKRPEDRWGTALELARALRSASGIGPVPTDLPKIDVRVRDVWLARAPQPLAEAVAALDGARNAHELRERVQELVRNLLRYLLAVAIATRAKLDDDPGAPELLELVRALGRRDLTGEERLQLLRLLVRKQRVHPIPELGELVTPDAEGSDALDAVPALYSIADHSGTDSAVRLRLRELLPHLNRLLHRTMVVFAYVLIVPRHGAGERWTGVRKQRREIATVLDGEFADGHPLLLDQHGRVRVDLWPLAQVATPSNGSDDELFVFEGRGRHGAQLIAAPRGITRDDSIAWAWVETRLIAEVELKSRMSEQLRMAARQWQDRGRSEGLLWRGDALADLERWTRHTTAAAPLGDPEASFVAASRRVGRRVRWMRRLLIATGFSLALGGVEYRSVSHDRMAEHEFVQAEVEQGRQALVHGELAEALQHLAEAYRRGDHSPGVLFMFARALQPRLAELAQFTAMAGRMWSATFSPDGQQIVTTDDVCARIWDAQTRQLIFTLPHGDTVYDAHYSADGTRLVTAGGDGAVRIWDTRSGALVRELRQEGKPLRYVAVAVTNDGRLAAAIDLTGAVVHVWDTGTGAALMELHNDASDFPVLSFSADGRWLATSGGDDIHVFDANTWIQATTIADLRVRALSFDPTVPRLATGDASGDASIWDIPSGTRVRHLRESGESIGAIAFAPDGRYLVTGSADGTEQIWDGASGALRSELKVLRSKLLAVEWDPTSQLVLAAGANGSVVVADAAGMPVTVLDGPRNLIWAAHFDPSSQQVVGASWDGTARVWDATSPYRRWSAPPVSDDCGLISSLEPDRRFVAVGCRDRSTRIWDTTHGQLLAELPSVTPVIGDFTSAFPAVTAAGDRAAIARGNAVEIYELPGGRLLRSILHSAPVNAVAFAPTNRDLISGAVDGSLFVTRDSGEPVAMPRSPGGIDAGALLVDGRVVAVDAQRHLRVIDADHGSVLADLELPTRVRMLRPSPDGVRLVTVPSFTGPEAPPILWDLERYRLVAPLVGHVGRVYSARFVEGRRIVTTGGDLTVRSWDSEMGRLHRTYSGGSRFLIDAMLNPDDSMVVAGDGDGVLWFWDAAGGRLLWQLQTHRSHVIGIHFEDNDIVTRGFGGDVSRWTLPTPDRVIQAVACKTAVVDGDACVIVAP